MKGLQEKKQETGDIDLECIRACTELVDSSNAMVGGMGIGYNTFSSRQHSGVRFCLIIFKVVVHSEAFELSF